MAVGSIGVTLANNTPTPILTVGNGSNIAIGHSLFDVNGSPLGVAGNPMIVQTTSTATGSSTSSVTFVAASNGAASLLAANANRNTYTLTNTSSSIAYVLEGAGTVSPTYFTFPVAPGQPVESAGWKGAVSAIWSTTDGGMAVTEQTP